MARYKDRLLAFGLLLLATFLGFGWMIRGFFYHDDYAVLYHVQNKWPLEFPYYFNYFLGRLTYYFFGLNYRGYYLLNYFLAVLGVLLFYSLLNLMFKDRLLALLGALFFSAGYVGCEEISTALSPGMVVWVALNLFFLSFIFFIKYEKGGRLLFLFLSVLAYFGTVAIMPCRFGSIFLVYLWYEIIIRRTSWSRLIKIGFVYTAPLMVVMVWGARAQSAGVVKLTNFTKPVLFLNAVGTFGNLFVPSVVQSQLLEWGKISFFKSDIFSILLGGGIILVTLVVSKRAAFGREALWGLGVFGGVFILYWAVGLSDVVMESSHRYLFFVSWLPSVFLGLLITEKNRLIYMVFGALLAMRLIANDCYVKKFLLYYKNASTLIGELKGGGGDFSGKSVFYFEGETKVDGYLVGDVFRVGMLPSEVSLATWLGKKMEEVVIVDQLDEMLVITEEEGLDLNNVHTFVYSYEGLENTTNLFKSAVLSRGRREHNLEADEIVSVSSELLNEDGMVVVMSARKWLTEGEDYVVFPKLKYRMGEKVKSLVPLRVKMQMRAGVENQEAMESGDDFDQGFVRLVRELLDDDINYLGDDALMDEFGYSKLDNGRQGMVIGWRWDTYGPLAIERSGFVDLIVDDKWHDYELVIPAGGRYLEKLEVEEVTFPVRLEIGDLKIVS